MTSFKCNLVLIRYNISTKYTVSALKKCLI